LKTFPKFSFKFLKKIYIFFQKGWNDYQGSMRAIVRLQFAYQMNLSELHENGRIQYNNSDGELISIESFEKLTSIDHAQLAAKATGGVASECILNLVSSSKRRAKSMSQLFIPVLCTVVLKYTVGKSAKFWNMNSCVWVV
jgi:hypothetical protein